MHSFTENVSNANSLSCGKLRKNLSWDQQYSNRSLSFGTAIDGWNMLSWREVSNLATDDSAHYTALLPAAAAAAAAATVQEEAATAV